MAESQKIFELRKIPLKNRPVSESLKLVSESLKLNFQKMAKSQKIFELRKIRFKSRLVSESLKPVSESLKQIFQKMAKSRTRIGITETGHVSESLKLDMYRNH